jgi:hypothetical protein
VGRYGARAARVGELKWSFRPPGWRQRQGPASASPPRLRVEVTLTLARNVPNAGDAAPVTGAASRGSVAPGTFENGPETREVVQASTRPRDLMTCSLTPTLVRNCGVDPQGWGEVWLQRHGKQRRTQQDAHVPPERSQSLLTPPHGRDEQRPAHKRIRPKWDFLCSSCSFRKPSRHPARTRL